MMNRIYILLLVILCPLLALAQKHSELQERALKGKVKTIVQYDYDNLYSKLKSEKIADSSRWYRKLIYHYDTLGNLQKKETYVQCVSPPHCIPIISILIYKKVNNQTIADHFNENNILLDRAYFEQTSDTSYTISVYDAKSKNLKYTNEQFLNANYRDIGSKFSLYNQENGIRKLVNTITYKNTIDSNGRLLKGVEVDSYTFAQIETIYKYLATDKKGNPTKIVQYKLNKPVLLNTRIYSYYE